MTRLITRSLAQFGILIAAIFILIWIADSRYRVLPEKIHNSLPLHYVGTVITDITIKECSSLNPLSTCRLDPDQWHRVEKDLYLNLGWTRSSWLHIQRKKEEELTVKDKIIIDLRVSKVDPGIGEKGHESEKWESRPGGIWVLRGNRRADSDPNRAITGVDVLFGADAVEPRQGWTLATTPLLIDTDPRLHPVRITTRHGHHAAARPSPPRVTKDGKFKILQVSDMHLATGVGKCREAIDASGAAIPNCEADIKTLDFVESVLDSEQPDLVVLSGDQVEGPEAPDTQTAILKYAAPLIERSIPYATIFGNHDDEGSKSLSRAAQMSLVETLPFSLSEAGPQTLPGVGNYYVEVLAHSGQHSAITLYLLDSHGLSPDDKKYPGYDWIKPQQIDWFNATAESLKKSHNKYSHIHLDMAFIHIPLPEYAEADLLLAGGKRLESVTAPGFNTHFYDILSAAGVVAVGCGHDHVNDYCALRKTPHLQAREPDAPETHAPAHHGKERLGPWMCYAGGSGFGGYGGYGGFHRRVRVWEIDTNAGRVTTWKRVECCGEDTKKKIDELVIVEGGVVVAPGE
ncbi:hypothetical protein AMS68_002358 [Peltaster fructicola]|uniref:Calcineurin-like phosphoesterase domain-containing protein n=1 Tax=Peltaster fructicola TaxID=286661 RepID=A0A6H0XQB4_9PEZI|nr:hypothetical protein AMS68_002358 [Peltaster fructicola]